MSNSTLQPPFAQRMRTLARELRRTPTEAEAKLWAVLRDRRLAHIKWPRQAPIGRHIVDFVCLEYHVIVECDGSQHAESKRDAVRDAWLASQGFRVVRFWNNEVLGRRESVIETILSQCGLPF